MALSFAAQNQKWAKDFLKYSDEIIKEASIEVFSDIVDDSPIKSGAFVNAWLVNLPDQQFEYGENTTKSAKKQEIKTEISRVKDFGEFTFSNNAPYAERLEMGWSDQAPAGFFRLNMQRLDSVINRIGKGKFK